MPNQCLKIVSKKIKTRCFFDFSDKIFSISIVYIFILDYEPASYEKSFSFLRCTFTSLGNKRFSGVLEIKVSEVTKWYSLILSPPWKRLRISGTLPHYSSFWQTLVCRLEVQRLLCWTHAFVTSSTSVWRMKHRPLSCRLISNDSQRFTSFRIYFSGKWGKDRLDSPKISEPYDTTSSLQPKRTDSPSSCLLYISLLAPEKKGENVCQL